MADWVGYYAIALLTVLVPGSIFLVTAASGILGDPHVWKKKNPWYLLGKKVRNHFIIWPYLIKYLHTFAVE